MPDRSPPTRISGPPQTRAEYLAARHRYTLKLRAVEQFNRIVCRLWHRCRRIGPCTIPADGPVIITANHTCSADPMMIYAGCGYRHISFMIAREFANLPIGGWFVRLIDCIPVRRDGRDASATKQAIRRLRDGHAMAIFIQGRIPRPDEHVEPKDGVALLALRTGAPVIPVHLSGNKYRESILGGLIARHRSRVRYGPPVDLSAFGSDTCRENVVAATARIWQAIQSLAPDQPSDN